MKDFQIFDPFSDIVASLFREKSDWYIRGIYRTKYTFILYLERFHEVPRGNKNTLYFDLCSYANKNIFYL